MPRVARVADIKANLLRPALTSHFEVEIPIPPGLQGSPGFLPSSSQRKLNMMCSEAVLPGSQLATIEILNDYQGVTERHAYRRQFDQSIDLTFYVDAEKYIPIKFFERWISLAMNEGSDSQMSSPYYSYRAAYPDGPGGYTASGLTVRKFERDHKSQIEYEFVKSFPLAITSMPVSYEASSLLKCSVQMTYIRYVLKGNQSPLSPGGGIYNPFQQSQFNAGGFLSGVAANLVDSAVDRATGSDMLGDIAGGLAGRAVRNLF